MAYPLGMDAVQFLSLDPKEKKRLAAERSRDRRLAQKAGQALPPTIGEELGLSAPKAPKAPKAQKTLKAPALKDPEKMTKEEREARRQRVLAAREQYVPAGPVAMAPRTICGGMLHYLSSYNRGEYEAAARERGFTNRLPLMSGEKEVGALYFKEMTKADRTRLQAIFSVTKTPAVQFGKKEVFN